MISIIKQAGDIRRLNYVFAYGARWHSPWVRYGRMLPILCIYRKKEFLFFLPICRLLELGKRFIREPRAIRGDELTSSPHPWKRTHRYGLKLLLPRAPTPCAPKIWNCTIRVTPLRIIPKTGKKSQRTVSFQG